MYRISREETLTSNVIRPFLKMAGDTNKKKPKSRPKGKSKKPMVRIM